MLELQHRALLLGSEVRQVLTQEEADTPGRCPGPSEDTTVTAG